MFINFLKNIFNLIMTLMGRSQQLQNSWNSSAAEQNAKQISKEEAFTALGNQEWSIPRKLLFPVKRSTVVVTSPFGIRYLQGVKQMHIGVDFRTNDSRIVRAVEDGIIKKVLGVDNEYPCRFKWNGQKWVPSGSPKNRAWTPYVVLIGKWTKNRYVYKHIAPSVKEGQLVEAGQDLGETGNYGYSMGEHLHFEYYDWIEKSEVWAEASDPMLFFRKMGLDVKSNVVVEMQHGDLMQLVV